MEAIHVMLEADLLKAAERAARKLKTNRSALFRDALRAHLRRIELAELEQRDRDGYANQPELLDR